MTCETATPASLGPWLLYQALNCSSEVEHGREAHLSRARNKYTEALLCFVYKNIHAVALEVPCSVSFLRFAGAGYDTVDKHPIRH